MTIDYDSLERAHKQEGWSEDQQRHFEMGWEAGQYAMRKRLMTLAEDFEVDNVPMRPAKG